MRTRTHTTIATAVGALALLLGSSASADASGGGATYTWDEVSARVLLDQRSVAPIDATTEVPITMDGDRRSPDTRDAALAATETPITMDGDRRSPDTRDAALAATQTPVTPPRDMRSPDTRDAALALTSRATPVDPAKANRFDWTDAGIGATSGFGIALLAAGALLLIRRSNGRQLAV